MREWRKAQTFKIRFKAKMGRPWRPIGDADERRARAPVSSGTKDEKRKAGRGSRLVRGEEPSFECTALQWL